MEQNPNTSLFSLNLDQLSKEHLLEASRWGKFLAIIGFIVIVLVAIAGLFFMFSDTVFTNPYASDAESEIYGTQAYRIMMAVVMILMCLLYFFPCLFLYRFSTKIRRAIHTNDQHTMNVSFQNLKSLFRFVGIVTLIILIFYAIILIIALLGAAGS
jgi:NADH:ubiquinone oxidoreductase subunit 5 (subunit L)/multisubunit Na+/H+ antiporter MnhA subunit